MIASLPLREGYPVPKEFSEWLRMVREARGLSMTVLGQKAGIHYSHVSKLEGGKANPSREMVLKLTAALGVTDPNDALIAAGFLPEIEERGAVIVGPDGQARYVPDFDPNAVYEGEVFRIMSRGGAPGTELVLTEDVRNILESISRIQQERRDAEQQ